MGWMWWMWLSGGSKVCRGGARRGGAWWGGVVWLGMVLRSMTASTDEEYMAWGWPGWDAGTHPTHPILATTYSHRVGFVFHSHKLKG